MKGAMCNRCKAVKPVVEFKTWLTRAQALARGYTGLHRIEIDSSLCKACRPKRKPLSKLTAKELHNRAVAGDLRPFFAEVRQAVIEARKHSGKVAGGHARAQSLRKAAWDALSTPIKAELVVCQQQEKYALKQAQTELARFFRAYITELTSLRESIKVSVRIGDKAPTHTTDTYKTWVEFAPETSVNKLREMWESLPIAERKHRKMPSLFNAGAVIERYVKPTTGKAGAQSRLSQD